MPPPPAPLLFLVSLRREAQQLLHGGGHRDGGDGAHQDAGEQGKGEAVESVATEQQQSPHREQGGARGDHGTAESGLDGHVGAVVDPHLGARAEQVPQAVGDDDAVVEGVADHRHQTGDDVEVELDVEQRQQPQRHQAVVQHRHQDADGLAPLEAHRQVGGDGQRGYQYRQHPLLEQLGAHLGPTMVVRSSSTGRLSC